MNRKIKFRAWDHIDARMYPYTMEGFNGEMWVRESFDPGTIWKNIGCGRWDGVVDYDFDIMHYTGLQDKNGDDVFESDIVRDTLSGTLHVIRFGPYCTDAIHGNGFYEVPLGTNDVHAFYELNWCEVVGNIWQNTELISEITQV